MTCFLTFFVCVVLPFKTFNSEAGEINAHAFRNLGVKKIFFFVLCNHGAICTKLRHFRIIEEKCLKHILGTDRPNNAL